MRSYAAELLAEKGQLVWADRDIARGEQRIREQQARVAKLRKRSGGNEQGAEHLLQVFEETLAQWQAHRVLILERIAYLEHRVSE